MFVRLLIGAFLTAAMQGVASAEEPKSSGTGFAVTADGWVLTNAHVIEGCSRIEVKGRGTASDPRIDATNDLALIKVASADPMTPLVFRKARQGLAKTL